MDRNNNTLSKNFIEKINFPYFMEINAPWILIFSIGLILFSKSRFYYSTEVIDTLISSGYETLSGLIFILIGGFFLFINSFSFGYEYIKYLFRRNKINICERCGADMNKVGFTRFRIDKYIVGIRCNNCGYNNYRKGLF